jgi:hypothetical protein
VLTETFKTFNIQERWTVFDPACYEPSYLLLKEARESWKYAVSDKIIDPLNLDERAFDSCFGVSKDYLDGRVWIEIYLTFETNGHYHFVAILDGDIRLGTSREDGSEVGHAAVNRNPSVFIDIAQQIQPPKKVILDRCPIRSMVRLNRFDDADCLCGYSPRKTAKPLFFIGGDLIDDRKLSVNGVIESQPGQSKGELIQGRASAIEKIAENENGPVRNVQDLLPDDIESILKIFFTDQGTGFGFVEGIKFMPQCVEMHLRPRGLQIGIGKRHAYKDISRPPKSRTPEAREAEAFRCYS